jgi:rRNA small subunit pseudouridine methyltransferase Nep1
LVHLLNLIIADASIETIPNNLYRHHSLKKIRLSGKKPHDILLDRSFHHFAMVSSGIENDHKRGRPDILHIALVNALATPLYRKNMMKIFIHTINNNVILVGDNVRIPKSYMRFEGLILNLFKNKNKKIVSDDGQILLEIKSQMKIGYLIKEVIKADTVVGFSTTGSYRNLGSIAMDLSQLANPCVVIGGFPKGYFSESVDLCFNKKYSISDMGLESQVVISRLIYEYEKNVLA